MFIRIGTSLVNLDQTFAIGVRGSSVRVVGTCKEGIVLDLDSEKQAKEILDAIQKRIEEHEGVLVP